MTSLLTGSIMPKNLLLKIVLLMYFSLDISHTFMTTANIHCFCLKFPIEKGVLKIICNSNTNETDLTAGLVYAVKKFVEIS